MYWRVASSPELLPPSANEFKDANRYRWLGLRRRVEEALPRSANQTRLLKRLVRQVIAERMN